MNIILLLFFALFIGAAIEIFYPSRKQLSIPKIILFAAITAILGSYLSGMFFNKNISSDLFDPAILIGGAFASAFATFFLKHILSKS